MKRFFAGCLPLICASVLLAGCDQVESKGDGWKVVGQFNDGIRTRLVEIAPNKAKSRETYDAIIQELCKEGDVCSSIAFILQGDRVPVTQDSKTFFAEGGWSNYPTLAFWAGKRNSPEDGYTHWDCDRAGVGGAPLNALCGEGVRDAYKAILSIAGRNGIAEACGWGARKRGPDVIKRYLNTVSDLKRRDFFQETYNQHYASSRKGPDNRADCTRLRSKIESRFDQAKKLLEAKS